MRLRFKIDTPNILHNAEEVIRKYWENNPIFLPDNEREEIDKLNEFIDIISKWTNGGKSITIEIDFTTSSATVINETENT